MKKRCFDHLGWAHLKYPRRMILENTPPGSGFGAFHRTAGPLGNFGPLEKYLPEVFDSKKHDLYRFQMYWHDSHYLVPEKFLKNHLPIYEDFAKSFTQWKFYISFSCEYNCKVVREVQRRVDLVRDYAPHCEPVNCPNGSKGIILKDCLNETHEWNKALPGRYGTSTDGANGGRGLNGVDIFEWLRVHERAEYAFAWNPDNNLNPSDGSKIKRQDRKKGPTKNSFLSVVSAIS